MATRFYFDNAITAPVSHTFQAAWNVTTGAVRRMMYPGKTLYAAVSATVNVASGASGAVAARKMLTVAFLSQPLIAQTINSGSTIGIQFRCTKNETPPTCSLIAYVRLCDEDGTNLSEIGNASSTAMINGTPANRTITITLAGNITVADNQRIIVEVGGNYTVGSSTTLTATVVTLLAPATGDLPVDNTSTSILNPWIEFSQTLSLRKESFF